MALSPEQFINIDKDIFARQPWLRSSMKTPINYETNPYNIFEWACCSATPYRQSDFVKESLEITEIKVQKIKAKVANIQAQEVSKSRSAEEIAEELIIIDDYAGEVIERLDVIPQGSPRLVRGRFENANILYTDDRNMFKKLLQWGYQLTGLSKSVVNELIESTDIHEAAHLNSVNARGAYGVGIRYSLETKMMTSPKPFVFFPKLTLKDYVTMVRSPEKLGDLSITDSIQLDLLTPLISR